MSLGAHATSIETGEVSLGVFDINFCYQGREGWIELKIADNRAPYIRPSQIQWANRRVAVGGYIMLLMLSKYEEDFGYFYLVPGAKINELTSMAKWRELCKSKSKSLSKTLTSVLHGIM
jgi:hypothetical protein